MSGAPAGAAALPPGALLRLDRVLHVGTFDPAGKKDGSHEGSGLSVSLDPQTWRSLARLGAAPTWELRRAGGQFVEYHAALADPSFVDRVFAYAVAEGYVSQGTRYEVHTYDDELEDTVFSTYDTRAAAEAEVGEGDDDEDPIKEVPGYLLTAKAAARARHANVAHAFVRDFALFFYVEDTLPTIDGLWWDDADDPARYSAPRGAIFPSRVAQWSRSRLDG